MSNELEENEKWIPGYEGRYSVNVHGEVFSHYFGKIKRKPTIDRLGYETIALTKDNKRVCSSVHRTVASCFIENPNKFKEVNHKDGDKLNNKLENLEWCSRKDNMKHAFKIGLINNLKGDKHPGAKLTEEQAIEIKFSGKSTRYFILKYNLDKSTINKIKNGTNWKHLRGK